MNFEAIFTHLMQEDEESVIDYAKLKEKAHDRETWRQ